MDEWTIYIIPKNTHTNMTMAVKKNTDFCYLLFFVVDVVSTIFTSESI